ncbi:hypothetical protein V6N13_137664 [Hibiscus sabdariffa]
MNPTFSQPPDPSGRSLNQLNPRVSSDGVMGEVCGTRLDASSKGPLNQRKEPAEDDRFGPWMQVVNRRRCPGVQHRPSNQAGLTVELNGGSHFGVLEDMVEPQLLVSLPQQVDTGTAGTAIVTKVPTGLDSVSTSRPLGTDQINGQQAGVVARGVMSTTTVESVIVVPRRALSPVNVQAMHEGSRPSDGHVTEEVVDMGLTTKPVVVNSVQVPSVAAKGKVFTAPSSLQASKHTTVRVIDESSKRILQEHNGKARYGPIRSASVKGAKRISNVSKPVARKDTKVKSGLVRLILALYFSLASFSWASFD